MKTIAICFVALFAGALAAPLLEDDDFFELPNIDDAGADFDEKIVGGVETTIQAHPHQVILKYRFKFICGGSVLTKTRVLTAAHCLQASARPAEYLIVAGTTLLAGDPNSQGRPLSKIVIHPKYRPNHYPNDIAVLHLKYGLYTGTVTVRPIKFAAQGAAVPYGQNCNVTGWGTTAAGGSVAPRLRVVTQPLVSNEECNRAYNGSISADMLCAGAPEGGRDACQGDSGGPLTVNGVLLGVVSWGRGCGLPRTPGVYARVAFFSKWISENL